MKTNMMCIMVAAIFTFSSIAIATDSQGNPGDMVQKANRLFQDEKYVQALDLYRNAKPNEDDKISQARLFYNQANCYYKKGEYNTAGELYQQALTHTTDKKITANATYNLANCDLQQAIAQQNQPPQQPPVDQGKELQKTLETLNSAARNFRKTLDLNPTDKNAVRNMSITKKMSNKIRQQLKQQQQKQDQKSDQKDDQKDQDKEKNDDKNKNDKNKQDKDQDKQNKDDKQKSDQNKPDDKNLDPDAHKNQKDKDSKDKSDQKKQQSPDDKQLDPKECEQPKQNDKDKDKKDAQQSKPQKQIDQKQPKKVMVTDKVARDILEQEKKRREKRAKILRARMAPVKKDW